MKPETRARKDAAKKARRNHTYGIQVRLHTGEWAWVKPDTQLTRKPMEAAKWTGRDGETSALEAARTLSDRLRQLTFRVTRF